MAEIRQGGPMGPKLGGWDCSPVTEIRFDLVDCPTQLILYLYLSVE